jgi:hypothetical protein
MRGISCTKEPQHAEDLCWVSRFAAAEAGAGVNDLPAPVEAIGCGNEEIPVWEPLIRRPEVGGLPRRLSAKRAASSRIRRRASSLESGRPREGRIIV